jgi:mRNA-degrading endonuclease RelE of RelBE toxin-antitoxin system
VKVLLDPKLAVPVLRALEPSVRRRLKAAITSLGLDPSGRAGRLDVKRLETPEDGPAMYRLRVGQWRMAFAVEESALVVLRIFHRDDGYGWLKDMD